MTQTKTEVKTEAIGRVSGEPELAWTMGGVPVCRFAVATEEGPATQAVVKKVYVVGRKTERPSEELAVRCMKLALGDLVIIPGVERQRLRRTRGVDWVESAIEANNVRLRERARQTGGGA